MDLDQPGLNGEMDAILALGDHDGGFPGPVLHPQQQQIAVPESDGAGIEYRRDIDEGWRHRWDVVAGQDRPG